MPRILASLAGVALAAGLSAQTSVSDSNMQITSGAVSPTANTPVSFDLVSDALGIDQGYEHWWYYRLAGDLRESSLRSAGGLSDTVSAGGRHARRTFTDLDGRGILRAEIDLDVYSTGSTSGVLLSRLTVTNISNAQQSVDVFAYTDVDVAGTFGNDVCTGDASAHFVSDASGVQVEVRGYDADRSMVGAYPTVRNLLGDAAVNDLTNAAPPFAGDYTGAFQWSNMALQPLQSRTFRVVIAVDHPTVAVPAVESYGIANGAGFRAELDGLPLQDLAQPTTFGVRLTGAAPFAEWRIATGFSPWNALPFIGGIDLWVDPFQLIGIYAGFADANGEAGISFVIPTSPYVTGLSVFHQCFAVDAAAPNGFAWFSNALWTRVGKK